MNSSGFSYAKKGLIVRLIYLAVALLGFLLRRALGRLEGVVVLCYHSVTAPQKLSFERQMRYIAERVVSLDRIERASDRDAVVAVTFDDAFGCLLDNVIPVIRDLRVPISIFAVTENLGRAPSWLARSSHPDADLPTMSADQLKRLAGEAGVAIGSHSASHRRLGDLPATEVDVEISSSRTALLDLLGVPCDYLALPHGSYRSEVVDLAIRRGYRSVLTLDEISLPSRWPPGTVGRFSVSPDMWMVEFMLTVRGAYSWLHPWRASIRRLKRSFVELCHAR